MKRISPYFLASTAMLATLSIIFDLLPSIRVPWGMKIDFVGTVWVLGFYLYGLSEALLISGITTIYILSFSPTGLVGATMKFIATVPMFLVPAAITYLPFFFSEKKSGKFNSIPIMLVVCVVATLVRIAVASLVNLYWAVPLWWGGISPNDVIQIFGGIMPFVVFVASMNVLQGIVDSIVPWFLAFKVKLSDHFGTW